MTKTKAKTKILYRYEWFKRRPIVFKIIIKMFFWFHLQKTIILLTQGGSSQWWKRNNCCPAVPCILCATRWQRAVSVSLTLFHSNHSLQVSFFIWILIFLSFFARCFFYSYFFLYFLYCSFPGVAPSLGPARHIHQLQQESTLRTGGGSKMTQGHVFVSCYLKNLSSPFVKIPGSKQPLGPGSSPGVNSSRVPQPTPTKTGDPV